MRNIVLSQDKHPPRRSLLKLSPIGLVAVTVMLSPVVAAEQISISPILSDNIRVGIDGGYRIGQWTQLDVPIRVDKLSTFQGHLEVELPDPTGTAAVYTSEVGWDENSAPHEILWKRILVRFGVRQSQTTVRLVQTDGKTVSERTWPASQLPHPIPTNEPFVVSIGEAAGVKEAADLRTIKQGERLTHIRIQRPADLPDHVLGYSGVDAVLLATGEESQISEVGDERWNVLASWVRLGGKAIIGGAVNGERFFGGSGVLRELVPGEWLATQPQIQATGIEQFVAASVRLSSNASIGFSFPLAVIRVSRGKVLSAEGFGDDRRPTVVHANYGLGQTVFVTFDLDLPPFREWSDRGKLVSRLLNLVLETSPRDETARDELGPVAHVGYSDLIGQLREALDQFPRVRLIPFSWIAGLVALYIAFVGPIDYWLVHRGLRPERTWFTFLVTVILFTALAVGLALGWKGQETQVNQVTVLDGNLTDGTVRADTWSHVYVAKTQRIDVGAKPSDHVTDLSKTQHLTTWQGLPGDGFGGFDRTRPSSLFDTVYRSEVQIAPPDRTAIELSGLPIAVWSSRSFFSRWWSTADWSRFANNTKLSSRRDGTLRGQLTNPWPFDLRNALFLYKRWAYKIGNLPRESTIPIQTSMGTDLQTLLTQRKVVKGRNVVTAWDRQNTDLGRIMELLMFYQVAKGRAYTQLHHRYQDEVDWSRQLVANEAILWAEIDQPATDLMLNGEAAIPQKSYTCCRLLIPVIADGDSRP